MSGGGWFLHFTPYNVNLISVQYEPVIGLEIHAELNTKTKMFCGSLNDPDEKHPNVSVCPVCMGHPGTLPVINEEAIQKVIRVGLALGADIPEFSQFDRKNYFYPDLPKGYQISQFEHPLVKGGTIELPSRTIRVTRVHLEEDTGRLMHDKGSNASFVDFNRAGVPLMELVTEPDLRTGEEVRQFGEALQQILRYVRASDADMEKGQMRVEVNISLRPEGASEYGTKVEIKNINSFKYAADAVEYEIRRQTEVLEGGGAVAQETRGWNEKKNESFSQRIKEGSHDYRYFPEPDLPPLTISRERVAELKAALPELPREKVRRFRGEYGIEGETAEIISRDRDFADYFEQVVSEMKEWERSTPEQEKRPAVELLANIFIGDFLRLLNDTQSTMKDVRITPENFGQFVALVAEGKISSTAARTVFDGMFRTGADPEGIIREKDLLQVSDTYALEAAAQKVLAAHPKPAADFKSGNAGALQFIVGQVMKETKGKANPQMVQEILKKLLISH